MRFALSKSRGLVNASMPASLAKGDLGWKNPTLSCHIARSSPAIAVRKSDCWIAHITARLIPGLLNGGCRLLGRIIAMKPVVSYTFTVTAGFLRKAGRRSFVAWSHQSISPDCTAAAAVAASGIVSHSTRSKCATFGPANMLGVPEDRGTYASLRA